MSDEFNKNMMTQEDKDLLLNDLCARLPYGVMLSITHNKYTDETFNARISTIDYCGEIKVRYGFEEYEQIFSLEQIKPYLFPLSSMTDEDHAIYSKIWEDTGKTAYLEGCHHLICTIKAYKAANDYLLSKHYDINGLIPKGLANDATNKNIY